MHGRRSVIIYTNGYQIWLWDDAQGYGNDIFCTEDKAGKGRPSIMNPSNRSWLATTYGTRFATPRELHALLRKN